MTTLNVAPATIPPQQTLSYQTPQAYSTTSVWAKGNRVFATDYAIFPTRCVRCNGNERLEARGQSLKYVPLYAYCCLLLGLLPGALLMMFMQREVKVRVCVCVHCRRKNVLHQFATFAIIVAAFALLVAAPIYTKYLALVGVAVLITAIVYGSITIKRCTVTKIKNEVATLKGLGKPFIASLDQR